MEDLQLALTTSRTDQRNFGLWINNWQIGQSLNALVTSQLPSGELVLRVGGQQLTATSDIPIQQGAQLLLEVKQLKPVPLLQLVNAPEVSAARGAVDATLRLLPALATGTGSAPVAAVMQVLQTLQASPALPAAVAASIDELLRLVARPGRVSTGEGVARAVRDSGIFLEARLATENSHEPDGLSRDLKAGILRCLARTDAALAGLREAVLDGADAQSLLELKRELETALGRIHTHQIASQGGEGPSRSWQLEIPILWGNVILPLGLRIGNPESRSGSEREHDNECVWQVRLELSPPQLGSVAVDLKLDDERVRVDFQADRESTRRLVDLSLPLLDRALASRGLRLEAGPARQLAVVESPTAETRAKTAVDVRA